MVEKGFMESVKEGGTNGAIVGVSVAAFRCYLYLPEYVEQQMAEHAATKAASVKAHRLPSGLSSYLSSATTAAFRPTPLPIVLRTTGAYAGLGALYLGTDSLLRNTRDKDDMWNRVIAGALAGSLVGLRRQSWFHSGGAAASIAAGSILAGVLGGTLGPMDKEHHKKRHRKLYLPEDEQDVEG